MTDALTLVGGAGTRTVALGSYLTPDAEEQVHLDAYAWIKGLRHLPVDGTPFRDRFTARGDSLWWFSELYLHKTRGIVDTLRAIAALRALIERERPSAVLLAGTSPLVQHVASQLLARARISGAAPLDATAWETRLRSLRLRARRLDLLARLSPDRLRRPAARTPPSIAAFVHRAFWARGVDDGQAETYIGPVLRELEGRLGADRVAYVGVGPATHFRAHQVWKPGRTSGVVMPVERFAPRRALIESRRVWQLRASHFAALEGSAALRDWSVVGEVDCWPLVREWLLGIAWLQWPWSVRAMDEAAAALDALQPDTAVTYAEAGGWGRALILEARRRGIPTAGLQHGFIYRHWLNYLHEPDEMDGGSAFPYPTRTLLFDDYAAHHLRTRGHFPDAALVVTGSPRLDALTESVRQLPAETLAAVRSRLGLTRDVLLVATKEREARSHLPALIDAAARLPDVTVVIKPHPAEDASVYAELSRGRGGVRVVAAGEPLAPLLALARAVVTVNSTVALDAGVLGIPALSIGLPNNLSPFVETGALAGSSAAAELPDLLRRILYDERFRRQLEDGRRVTLGQAALRADGQAARRTAEVIGELAARRRMRQQA